MPTQDPAAFISYSREDSEFALRLAQDLKAAGAQVWLDQLDILPGRPWDNAIEQALGEALHMLIILSPSSAKSENVRNKISYALEQGKIIIPVLYKDCVVPLQLQRAQRIDFRADYARGLSHLLQHLHVAEPDSSVLQKAAEGDAQRQAAWQAREIEAQRMKDVTRPQQEEEGGQPSGTGAGQWKPLAIAGAALVAVAIVVALTVFSVRLWQQHHRPPTPVAGSDPVIGCYQWFNKAQVAINANHTIVAPPFTGSWQQVNATQRTYTLTWPQVSLDTVAVTPDQRSLNGGNQYGILLKGTRVDGSSGLVGTWSVISGVPMTITVKSDGSYSAVMATGTFGGRWYPDGPNVYAMMGWNLPKDSVTLSADGSRIAGADQFGIAISGQRTHPCNLD